MWNKYGIVVPGVIWGFLLVGIGYFLQANYPNEVWLPLVVVLIGAIIKYIELQTGEDLPDLPPMQEGVAEDVQIAQEKKPKKSISFFVG